MYVLPQWKAQKVLCDRSMLNVITANQPGTKQKHSFDPFTLKISVSQGREGSIEIFGP